MRFSLLASVEYLLTKIGQKWPNVVSARIRHLCSIVSTVSPIRHASAATPSGPGIPLPVLREWELRPRTRLRRCFGQPGFVALPPIVYLYLLCVYKYFNIPCLCAISLVFLFLIAERVLLVRAYPNSGVRSEIELLTCFWGPPSLNFFFFRPLLPLQYLIFFFQCAALVWVAFVGRRNLFSLFLPFVICLPAPT